ncbi:D-hexose-6-phosphate mutarotase [Psychrosphaera haliotis]|uniref:D-hexose-6-phosphate mutarotase n=1 Tax=Psychrosphaera haliotis TaxID=555083 RepID=UPI0031D1B0E1
MRTTYVSTQLVDNQKLYKISHPLFKATLSEFGGQLLSYQDQTGNDWLWLSKQAVLDGSKPIRGGIPICWPWFGPALSQEQPQHGYARLVKWNIVSIEEDDSGVRITMQPNFNIESLSSLKDEQFPNSIKGLSLFLELDLGKSLKIHLHTENTSDSTVTFTQAIHSYFKVEDIRQSTITGLSNRQYLDQLNAQTLVQDNELKITQWTDKIYNSHNDLITVMNNKTSKNNLKIVGSGHDSVVIWNPWKEGAKKMSDFDDDGFIEMVCVEMANTKEVKLKPRESHTLTQVIDRN